jgi:uncharacterized protein
VVWVCVDKGGWFMKYVLVLLIVIVAAWVLMGRNRGRGRDSKVDDAGRGAADGGADTAKRRGAGAAAGATDAQTMVGCSHCGLHLPRSEAVADAQGRLYCSDVHRLAGPRQGS